MAETILAFGVQKLWDLLVRESGRFQGVQNQFHNLKRDLNMLSCFLKDADAKRDTTAMVMNIIKEIKEIVYDAEDIIENFLQKEETGNTSSIRKRVTRFSYGILESRTIASDMEAISMRISMAIRDLQSLGIQQVIVNDGQMQVIHERKKEMRTTFSNENESFLVGLEEKIMRLVGSLVEEDGSQVVSITGMGGIGKTTLAREVFNHQTIKNHFGGLAWVCVSQQFTRKYVWQTILRKLRPKYKVFEMTEDELQEKLFKVLETQKVLIVLDDIWREEDWDRIKPMIPRKRENLEERIMFCTRWKVLLTSRNEGVALRADPTCFTFKPDSLTSEESWALFRRIAFITTECKIEEEMEEMGKQMIKYCGGLPLALRVLGGLLAAKYTLQEWKRVSIDIRSHLMGRPDFSDDNNNSFYDVLSLSFEELPSYLKHCFLYLAHFPEDHQISVEKLSYYWAAERILKPRHYDEETIRDNGDSYIEELVRRNMVISKRNSRSLRFETCHLHDMMREVCLFKAKEENFLQIDGIHFPTSNFLSRRFVWQNPTTLTVEEDINNPKLRSLLIVLDDSSRRCVLSGLTFTTIQLLRVLDLSNAWLEELKLPDSIGKLIHLRYLSLERAKVIHLPSSLGNLKSLIYLNIDVNVTIIIDGIGRCISVPNILMGMQGLRYLALPKYMDRNTKLDMSNQVNLETLINFSTENNSLEDIHGMTKLRSLTIRLTEEASLETLYASVAELRHLETFFISFSVFIDHKYDKIVEKGFFSNMIHLKYLSLENNVTRSLNEHHFPPQLTCLDLCQCHLKEDPMSVLEKLPHLTEVNLSKRAFRGRKMVCLTGGFPQLHKLTFFGLYEWKEWVVEEGSMPLLHTLKIHDCNLLKELPSGLRFLYSLKALTVYGMGEKWEGRLLEGGKDYYKVQHIPSVTFR